MTAPTTTNFAKYQTGNPIVRRLIGGFLNAVREEVAGLRPRSILDAGCGEGLSLGAVMEATRPDRAAGVDMLADSVRFAQANQPAASFLRGDVTRLPFADESFDVVMCCEVLEHLDDPAAAIAELRRVARRALVLSVPHEPWFRLGSLIRGKYTATWGNHPEHVQHWDARSLPAFLKRQGLRRGRLRCPFPWLLATVRLDAR